MVAEIPSIQEALEVKPVYTSERFIGTRYPRTYAVDYIRTHSWIIPHAVWLRFKTETGLDPGYDIAFFNITRYDATKIFHLWLKMRYPDQLQPWFIYTQYQLLADRYLEEEKIGGPEVEQEKARIVTNHQAKDYDGN